MNFKNKCFIDMPMKVTVCFDRVKVVVPCGDGEILVSELIKKAITRFKKATGKPNDYWVAVHNLRTCNDGGILDPDDQLNDVVDDREQLIADYQEQGGPSLYNPHNGDGASASSTGTASPEHFQGLDVPNGSDSSVEYQPQNRHDVVVTPKDLSEGPGLTVRRGSEPVLNVIDDEKSTSFGVQKINIDKKHQDDSDSDNDTKTEKGMFGNEKDKLKKNPFDRFARDSWRQSLGNQPEMFKWLEAQERQQDKYKQMERRELLGGAGTDIDKDNVPEPVELPPPAPHPAPRHVHPPGSIQISLKNNGGPLGIHVIPEYDDTGKEMGLLVQGVEPGGRVSSDGRLRVDDRIVEINGNTLIGITFSKAQEIFRNAMTADEIRLRILKRKAPPPLPKQPPPVLPKPKGHTPVKPSPLTLPMKLELPGPVSPMSPDHTSTPAANSPEGPRLQSPDVVKSPRQPRSVIDAQPIKPGPPIKPPPVSPTKKVPPAVPTRHPSTSLSKEPDESSIKENIIAPTNTKKIGKKIEIQLTKGVLGLGFSVTTRDNPAGGVSPIYIKNILPKGAAIVDGRLKAGDRLLEVDGEDMTGKTQAEAVAMLRNIKGGAEVEIVVSRQETLEDKFVVPRELKQNDLDDEKQNLQNVLTQPKEKSGDDDGSLAIMKNKEIISLDIPLNDSGSAGLGVSVKGKTMTTEEGTRDLGIFIKSVIHGGAASKDGRLFINDQLLEVNGEKLMGLPNADAMETLRKAMQTDGPIPGRIHLVVARKIGAPSPSPFEQSAVSIFSQSESSEQTQKTESDDLHEIFNGAENNKENSPDILSGGVNSADFDDIDSNTPVKSLLDRLKAGNGLRNESYTRATHDSFNDSANIFSSGFTPHKPQKINIPSSEEIMVVEDDETPKATRVRPHSSIGILRVSPSNSPSSSSEDLHQQPPWLQEQDWNRHSSITSEEMSPGIDPAIAFNREGFGRQSMSEKRRGHLDPRGSEFYQRVKSNRDVPKAGKHGMLPLIRVGSAESVVSRSNKFGSAQPLLPQHGKRFVFNYKQDPPSSNLKRFSSLENLAVTGSNDQDQDSHDKSNDADEEDEQEDEDQSYPKHRMTRGRGCNESFRAAVDRSYDAPSSEHSTMDPSGENHDNADGQDSSGSEVLTSSGGFVPQGHVEEESTESGSFGADARTNSARSSMSSEATDEHGHKKGSKKGKEKKSGIFKGIFKLGKHKKSHEDPMIKIEVHDEKKDDKSAYLEHDVPDSANQKQDPQRPPDQSSWFPQNQQNSEHSHRQYAHHHVDQHEPIEHSPPTSFSDQRQPLKDPKSMTRAEWIQYLRSKHQQQHRERQGHYPLDDREETYEKQIQEEEKKFFGPSGMTNQDQDQEQRYRPSSRPSDMFTHSSMPFDGYGQGSRLDGYSQRSSSRPSEEFIQRPVSRPSEEFVQRPSSRPSEVYIQRPNSRPSEGMMQRQQPTEAFIQSDMTGQNNVFIQGQRLRSSSRQQYERPGSRTGHYPDQQYHFYPQNTNIVHPQQPNLDIVHRRQHSDQELLTGRHYSAQEYPTRQFSSRGPTPVEDFYTRRIPIRSQTPTEHWTTRDPYQQNRQLYGRQEPPPGGGYYGDNLFTYKDPVYPNVAGKRTVQSITQPGSAKV